MKATATEYLKKPYSRTLIPVGDGTFFAEILEFPGCFAEGQSPDEAYKNLEAVAESWIEAAQDQGQEIPEPFATHDFSGRIALRIPRSIHKQAAKFAEMDDTSLNQFFLAAIAARVGAEDFVERLSKRLEAKCMTFTTALPSYTIWEIGSVNIGTTQNIFFKLPEKSFIPFESFGPQVPVPTGQILIDKEAGNG